MRIRFWFGDISCVVRIFYQIAQQIIIADNSNPNMESLTTKTYIPLSAAATYRGERRPADEDAKLPSVPEEAKGIPNTNVMSLNFAEVEKADFKAEGDPVRCERCLAYLSKSSQFDSATKTWVCEFCDYPNVLPSLDPDELPTADIVTYADPYQEEKAQAEAALPTESGSAVIFCIDISGSMSNTSPSGGQMLKYMKSAENVSRLECVKIAVDEQLQKLVKNSPEVRVGFMLFGNGVTLVGDGTTEDYTFRSDLSDYNAIVAESRTLVSKYMTRPIRETLYFLESQLERIDTGGATALGPGLLASVELIAGKGLPGSKVILCTDGQANTGLGQVETEEENKGENTYNKIGELALQRGIVISLVSLVEGECRLEILSPCALKTGGNIVKINPRDLSSDFSEFLAEEVMAFSATVAVKLHRSMKFVLTNPSEKGPDPTVLVRRLGNVTPALVFTFEYSTKSDEELRAEKINLAKLKVIPFQVLMNYSDSKGVRCCKVISKMQQVTHAVAEAIQGVNVNVLTAHSMRKTGDYALQGRLDQARAVIAGYRELVRNSREDTEAYNRLIQPISSSVEEEQNTMAFREGHRSDRLIASITHTTKLIPQKKA